MRPEGIAEIPAATATRSIALRAPMDGRGDRNTRSTKGGGTHKATDHLYLHPHLSNPSQAFEAQGARLATRHLRSHRVVAWSRHACLWFRSTRLLRIGLSGCIAVVTLVGAGSLKGGGVKAEPCAIALSWTWLGRLAALRVHGAARVVPKSTFSWLVFWARWDAEGDGGADPGALHGLRAAVQARLAFPPIAGLPARATNRRHPRGRSLRSKSRVEGRRAIAASHWAFLDSFGRPTPITR